MNRWRLKEGRWYVSGPPGQENKEVIVTKRDGESKAVDLGDLVEQHGEFCLYEVQS